LKHSNRYFYQVSKNFNLIAAISILAAGVLVGGFLILSSKSGSAGISETLSSLFSGNQTQDPKMLDSDKDGLTDWQEEIYKTDPNNPDSDADGYFDGEEVMSGYDPLVAAPNDKLSDKAIEPRPKAGSLSGFNLTNELSKSIIDNLKNSAPNTSISLGSGSKEDIASGLSPQAETIVDNALVQALIKSPQLNFVPIIADNEIKTSTDDSRQAAENYTSQVAAVISSKAGFQKLGIEVAEEAIQTKNYSELDKYIIGYTESYKAIIEIAAPPSWKEIHKKNLSLLLASANIFQTIKFIDEDPLRTSLALQQYQQIVLPGFKSMANEIISLISAQKQK